MKMAQAAFALLLISGFAGAVMAQDGPRGNRGRNFGGGFGPGYERLTDALGQLDLTTEQKEKIEALKKELAPKAKALREKAEALRKETQALIEEARPKFSEVLNDEQKEKLKQLLAPRAGGRRAGRGGDSSPKPADKA